MPKKNSKNKKIAELEQEIKNLRKLVIQDELIKDILNRRGFYEKILHIFDKVLFVKRNKISKTDKKRKFLIKDFSLIFLDVDGLKKINDIYGHKSGDELIKRVGLIIKESVRKNDFVGRWGGDEFITALIGCSEEGAFKVAEKIRKAVNADKKIKVFSRAKPTVSIGVAEIDETILSIDDLIERADKAMYEAKIRRGKNCTIKYSEIP